MAKKTSTSNFQDRDRWVLSYADFMTLLFAFFVALYALSEKSSTDSLPLEESLNGVFEAVQKSINPINIGVPIAGEPKNDTPIKVEPSLALQVGNDSSSTIYLLLNQVIDNQFSAIYKSGQVSISESTNWVNIEFKSGLLFERGGYDLTNESVALLIFIAGILKTHPSVVLVEGNTDDVPINSQKLESNWHLSSLRSSSVVDELVYQGVNPKMIAPIGFSSEHPKVLNTDEDSRSQNRRVVIRISKGKADNLHDYLFK